MYLKTGKFQGTVPAEISLSVSSFYRNFFLSMHIKSPILPKQKNTLNHMRNVNPQRTKEYEGNS